MFTHSSPCGGAGVHRALVLAGLTLWLGWMTGHAAGENKDERAQAEKRVCIQHLEKISTALTAYKAEHNDLPNWLSDLAPKYLPDVTLLICPISRRTGKMENSPLSDPELACSYVYEFCPLPLAQELPAAPQRTRRELRFMQVEILGPGVPVVRCRLHNPHLNLGLNGAVYESPPRWEESFTNAAGLAALSPAEVFARQAAAKRTEITRHSLPPRGTDVPTRLLDLTGVYNALLTEDWLEGGVSGRPHNNLAALRAGAQTLGGLDFDVRGIVQLAGKPMQAGGFPREMSETPVGQKCVRVHFLHASAGDSGTEGKQIGSYIVAYQGQAARVEIPVIYGRDVRDWHWQPGEPASPELRVVWHGENDASRRAGRPLRLFLSSWTNLRPDLEVASIRFVSSLAGPAPFLLAITTE